MNATLGAPTRVAIYTRTARPDPNSKALQHQESALRKVATDRGWTEITMISEVRPHGISVIAMEQLAGHDVVLVTDMNRLGRQPWKLIPVFETIAKSGGSVVTSGGICVPPLLAAMLGTWHQHMSDVHADRTRAGIAAAKARKAAQQ
jgi:DNA invertase Pin-like site-specific DNA recombinase